MAELVIKPTQDTLEVGTFIDDDGERCVAIAMDQPNGHKALITMTVPFFEAFADYLADVVRTTKDEAYWAAHE